MDDSELEHGLALVARATEPPWGVTTYQGGVSFGGPPRLYAGTDERYGEPRPVQSQDDLQTICWLRNHADELLDAVRRATRYEAALTAIGLQTMFRSDHHSLELSRIVDTAFDWPDFTAARRWQDKGDK